MAQDAYRNGHNFEGHRFSAYAARREGQALRQDVYDTLRRLYRTWLLSGWQNFVA